MKYKISAHAAEQMIKRSISPKIVDNILHKFKQIIEKESYSIYQDMIDEDGKSYLYRVFVNTKISPLSL